MLILDDFTRDLTGNPPLAPNDYIFPLQTTEVDSHTPNIEQCGGSVDNIQEGEDGNVQFTTFLEFQLYNTILNAIAVYTATFRNPFNSLMGGKFCV